MNKATFLINSLSSGGAEKVLRIIVEELVKKYSERVVFLPLFALRLKKYIKLHHIKLIRSYSYRANYINAFVKLFESNHKVQTVNYGIISRYLKKGLMGKLNIIFISFLYSQVDLIALISKIMRYYVNKLCSFNTKQNPFNIEKIRQLSNEKVDDFK